MTEAVELAIALTTLLVEDEHFVALYEGRNYFSYNFCALYCGSTYSDLTFLVEKENLVELNSFASFCASEVVNEELHACFHLKLMTVNLYDCVHLFDLMYVKRIFPGGGALLLTSSAPSDSIIGCKDTTFFENKREKEEKRRSRLEYLEALEPLGALEPLEKLEYLEKLEILEPLERLAF